MIFKIKSELPDFMYEELLINHKLRPMFNILVNRCMEIIHIKEKNIL